MPSSGLNLWYRCSYGYRHSDTWSYRVSLKISSSFRFRTHQWPRLSKYVKLVLEYGVSGGNPSQEFQTLGHVQLNIYTETSFIINIDTLDIDQFLLSLSTTSFKRIRVIIIPRSLINEQSSPPTCLDTWNRVPLYYPWKGGDKSCQNLS